MNRLNLQGASVRGFSLIELMIVVLIVAILAAVGYPSYRDYVVRNNRADGKALLNRIAGEQERFFTAQGQYSDDLLGAKPNGLGFASALSERGCYRVTVAVPADGLSYTLTAAPQDGTGCGQQASHDTRCGSLTLTSLGVKDATGSDPGTCW